MECRGGNRWAISHQSQEYIVQSRLQFVFFCEWKYVIHYHVGAADLSAFNPRKITSKYDHRQIAVCEMINSERQASRKMRCSFVQNPSLPWHH